MLQNGKHKVQPCSNERLQRSTSWNSSKLERQRALPARHDLSVTLSLCIALLCRTIFLLSGKASIKRSRAGRSSGNVNI